MKKLQIRSQKKSPEFMLCLLRPAMQAIGVYLSGAEKRDKPAPLPASSDHPWRVKYAGRLVTIWWRGFGRGISCRLLPRPNN
jgi:hypothetical protein